MLPDADSAVRIRLPELRLMRMTADFSECDGPGLKRLTAAALTWLGTNHQAVNALNVFPVPDGDTGTNMLLTMQAAYREIANSNEPNVGKVAHAIAHGALMGARGNSGVILSQIWRGFARALGEQPSFDAPQFVAGMREARETAYKGVVKPVEGTILTVIKDCAEAAEAALQTTADLRSILEFVVARAHASVERTPDLLPVLRQAGVVDAGGMGLAIVLEGMLRYLRGESLDVPLHTVQAPAAVHSAEVMEQIEAGQDFEVVVDFRPDGGLELQQFYAELEKMGTSIQVGSGEEFFRMHIHVPTEKLYAPIEYTRTLGTVVKVSIENLVDQMAGQAGAVGLQAPPRAPAPVVEIEPGQIAAVAVAPGEGLARVLYSLGVAAVVSGGQTMNPSTQDILNAVNGLPTDRVVILPNNKNIILAAHQAAELSDKSIKVVPTRTFPQGISAFLALNPRGELEAVAEAMSAAYRGIETGEVTVATRSVNINGVAVREGQVIGLHNGELCVSGDSLEEVVLKTLEAMHAAERELITLYYGQDVSAEAAGRMAEAIREQYAGQEVEVVEGGQPHYPYILSAE